MDDQELQHYGIIGMRWGIRRSQEQLGHKSLPRGIRIYKDGRLEIDKGVDLQRLSRDSELDPMHRTYASAIKRDGVKYIAKYGGTDDRDYVIRMRAKEPLIAPSMKDAATTFAEVLLSGRKMVEQYVTGNGKRITEEKRKTLSLKPAGRLATELYVDFNRMLSSNPDILRNLGQIQDIFLDKIMEKGFNILLDENDF